MALIADELCSLKYSGVYISFDMGMMLSLKFSTSSLGSFELLIFLHMLTLILCKDIKNSKGWRRSTCFTPHGYLSKGLIVFRQSLAQNIHSLEGMAFGDVTLIGIVIDTASFLNVEC